MASEHFIFFDKALGLLGNPIQVVVLAQCQLMLAHIDRGLRSTFFTFHDRYPLFDKSTVEYRLSMVDPPEITAISFITSPSFRISSSRIISPSRVAMTDSGTISNFCRA